MKSLSRKRAFTITMFLWVVDIICVILLALTTKLLTTIVFGTAWTIFFGFLVWQMFGRIEKR